MADKVEEFIKNHPAATRAMLGMANVLLSKPGMSEDEVRHNLLLAASSGKVVTGAKAVNKSKTMLSNPVTAIADAALKITKSAEEQGQKDLYAIVLKARQAYDKGAESKVAGERKAYLDSLKQLVAQANEIQKGLPKKYPYVQEWQLKMDKWWKIDEDRDTEIKSLNNCLAVYDMADVKHIRHFLAHCSVESYRGTSLTEAAFVGDEAAQRRAIKKSYPDGKVVWADRGAGYIQLTGKYNQGLFRDDYYKKKNIIDKRIVMLDNEPDGDTYGATYIANRYPWEAACYFYRSYRKKGQTVYEMVENGAKIRETQVIVRGIPDAWELKQAAFEEISIILT